MNKGRSSRPSRSNIDGGKADGLVEYPTLRGDQEVIGKERVMIELRQGDCDLQGSIKSICLSKRLIKEVDKERGRSTKIPFDISQYI